MLNKPKNRKLATILAVASFVMPISGWHKFYLGQTRWGVIYVLFSWTPIPHLASVFEAIWYLIQDDDEFNYQFNQGIDYKNLSSGQNTNFAPERVQAIAEAMRQLDQLRQDGLISEYEFEQKRRQLLDNII